MFRFCNYYYVIFITFPNEYILNENQEGETMEARKFIHVEVTDVCSLKLIFLDHQTALHTSSIPFHD